MDGFRKQLTIKRKVVERNTKDVTSYREEYEEDARIVKKMEVRLWLFLPLNISSDPS